MKHFRMKGGRKTKKFPPRFGRIGRLDGVDTQFRGNLLQLRDDFLTGVPIVDADAGHFVFCCCRETGTENRENFRGRGGKTICGKKKAQLNQQRKSLVLLRCVGAVLRILLSKHKAGSLRVEKRIRGKSRRM